MEPEILICTKCPKCCLIDQFDLADLRRNGRETPDRPACCKGSPDWDKQLFSFGMRKRKRAMNEYHERKTGGVF